MLYLGDFPTGQTIYVPFHTFDSNDPSASVTITGLALADIKVYKNGSVTQRSSTAGFTLLDTDGIDFDGIVGIHGVSLDTTDNTDAGFWAASSDYWVIIDSVTIDAATVSFIPAIFSIDNRGLLRPTTVQRTLDVTATGAAGIDWGNIENKTTANDLSATDIQLCDTVTANTDMRGTDNAALASVLGALADAAAAGDPTSADTVMQYLKQVVNVLVGTAGIATFPAEAAPANLVSLAEVIRAIHADVTGLAGAAMRGTDGANTTPPPTVVAIRQEIDANSTQLTAISGFVDGIMPAKNAALNNVEFLMVDSTDHVTPKTGLTITATRSIDGGAWAAKAAGTTVAEVGNGIYQIDIAAADLNGDIITFRFTGTAADDRFLTIRTAG